MSVTRLKTVTPPPENAVTLEEAKLHARVEESEDDDLISGLITSATGIAQDLTDRTFVTTIRDWFLDCFPRGRGVLYVPKPPLISVDEIAYLDEAGVSQIMPTTDFKVDLSDNIDSRIYLVNAVNRWPITLREQNAVTIRFTAGYGAAADVDDRIKSAMKLMVAHWNENREWVILGQKPEEVPQTAQVLLGTVKHATV